MQFVTRSIGLSFVLGIVTTLIVTGVVNSQQPGRQILDPGGSGTENPDRAYSRGVRIGTHSTSPGIRGRWQTRVASTGTLRRRSEVSSTVSRAMLKQAA